MKLKQLKPILENVSSSLTLEQKTIEDIAQIIKTQCSDALHHFKNEGKVLLRGSMVSPGFYEIDSTTGTRKSTGTADIYNILLSDYAKENHILFADRKKSIICTPRMSTAVSYGSGLSLIFPHNDAIISRATTPDFWSQKYHSDIFKNDKSVLDFASTYDKLAVVVNNMIETSIEKNKTDLHEILQKNNINAHDEMFVNDTKTRRLNAHKICNLVPKIIEILQSGKVKLDYYLSNTLNALELYWQ